MADPATQFDQDQDPFLAHWKTVLEQMPAGVILARAPDGRLVFGNEAAKAIWRQPTLECESIGAYELWRGFHPDGRPYHAYDWPLARSLRGGEVVTGEEIEIVRGDGTRAVLNVNSSPIRDEDAQVIAAVETFTDITHRKRYESGRRFLNQASTVLSSSLDYTLTLANVARLAVPTLADWCAVDIIEDGKIQRLAVEHVDPAKAALARELGEKYPPSLEDSTGVAQVLRTGKPELIPKITDAMLRATGRSAEHARLLLELGIRSVMIVPLVARGKILGDITLAASESGRSFGPDDLSLAQELAALAALAIDNARFYQASQSANQAKADFLSVISHELRTPLTAVIGYAELLALGIPEPVTERQREQIDRIDIAARHLLQLIEEILTITSLEAGTISIQKEVVRLSEILRRAEAITRPLAMNKSLALEVRLPPDELLVETDPDRLLQVFLNLLSNAVKFTEEGSVEVSVNRREGFVEVAVSDTGIGITPAEKERIFDTFWQAEQPTTRRAGGTGIGLSISRRLLHLLGGTLEVQSEPGKGSTFTARIPAYP